MVKHIVLWKIKDDDNKQKNIDLMIEMLTSLVGKIDGLVGIEMGYNFDVSSEYDVVLYATFKNAVALKYYQNHP
ncbi:MAG: Dabb family protein, partial [Acutalibacteraceae bacterium]